MLRGLYKPSSLRQFDIVSDISKRPDPMDIAALGVHLPREYKRNSHSEIFLDRGPYQKIKSTSWISLLMGAAPYKHGCSRMQVLLAKIIVSRKVSSIR